MRLKRRTALGAGWLLGLSLLVLLIRVCRHQEPARHSLLSPDSLNTIMHLLPNYTDSMHIEITPLALRGGDK